MNCLTITGARGSQQDAQGLLGGQSREVLQSEPRPGYPLGRERSLTVAALIGPSRPSHQTQPVRPFDIAPAASPKFLTGSDGILLIRQEIIQSSISNYWQQGEQRIGLGLQRSRLWHLLKAWGGVFRFQPIGHACSTG